MLRLSGTSQVSPSKCCILCRGEAKKTVFKNMGWFVTNLLLHKYMKLVSLPLHFTLCRRDSRCILLLYHYCARSERVKEYLVLQPPRNHMLRPNIPCCPVERALTCHMSLTFCQMLHKIVTIDTLKGEIMTLHLCP